MQTRSLFLIMFIILLIENLQAQKVEVLGDAKITGKMEVMDTILFSDGTKLASACLDSLADMDGDTYLTLEKNPDEDVIRLFANGNEIMVISERNIDVDHNGSIFIGDKFTGFKDDGGNNNIFLGKNTGVSNISGRFNIFMGTSSGNGNSSGNSNILIGSFVGNGLTTGSDNIFIGDEAGSEENSSRNVFIGSQSGFNNGSTDNTFLGYRAGYSNSGRNNVFVGSEAGWLNRGSGNIFIGEDAGNYTSQLSNTLIIENSNSITPLIFGNFSSNTLQFNATATVTERLLIEPGEAVLSSFSVKANNIQNHIAEFINESPSPEADGILIKINRDRSGPGNNFITFSNEVGIAGRIEGFRLGENNLPTSFPQIDFSLYFNPISIENLALNPGQLPSLSGGSLPSLSGGSLPALSGGSWPNLSGGSFPTLNRGTFPSINPGTLPSLSGGSFGSVNLSVDFDDLAWNLGCQANPACSNYRQWITAGISGASFPNLNPGTLPYLYGGSLPSLSGGSWPNLSGGSFPTLNPGSLPTFNPGTLPTLNPGQLPSLNFDVIFNPTPLVTAAGDFKQVLCWALENGERSLITTNPWDLALLQGTNVLSLLAECKDGGVTYGSGGADYAEYLLRADENEIIEEGQIVGVKGGKISKNTEEAEQLLVISMMPIVLGNIPEDSLSEALYEKVAFLGQAPVWVVGKVRSGDYIIPSGHHDGYGLAIAPEDLRVEHISKIVGRAWGDGNNTINLVNMVIGLKTNEMAEILSRNEKKVNDLESRLLKVEAALGMGVLASSKS